MLRRRLPPTAVVLFAIAALCALSAAGLLRGYARRLEATRPDLGTPVSVVVAAADLIRGDVLAQPMLTERDVPGSLAPPGAMASIETVVGRVLSSDLAAGEVVTRTRLAGDRAGPVAGLVPDGSVGMVISSGLPAGAVTPGDRITLLATFGGRTPHTETVAASIEVARVLPPSDAGAIAPAGGDVGEPLVVVVETVVAERMAYAAAFATLSVAVEAPLSTVVAVSSPTAPIP